MADSKQDNAPRPALPTERAFVVQLRADADLEHGIVRGRVEHVTSGVAAIFDSVEQLLACMRDALATRAAAAGRTLYGRAPATPAAVAPQHHSKGDAPRPIGTAPTKTEDPK